jgi:hypothetical protein
MPTAQAGKPSNDPALKEEIKGLRRGLDDASKIIAKLVDGFALTAPPPFDREALQGAMMDVIECSIRGVRNANAGHASKIEALKTAVARVQTTTAALLSKDPPAPGETPAAAPPPVRPRPVQTTAPRAEGEATGPEQRILDAILWLNAVGVADPENPAVAFAARYSPNSSSYEKARGALKSQNLIVYPSPGVIHLTAEGRAASRDNGIPADKEHLRDVILGMVTGPEARILGALIEVYDRSLSNEELAAAAKYSAMSSSYEKARGHLRTLDLLSYTSPGMIRAAAWLFDEDGN